jgi:hypothetical protein
MEGSMKSLHLSFSVCLATFLFDSVSPASEKEVINAFTQVGAKGLGNDRAVRALSLVDQLNPSSIVPLLKGMNVANDLGDNWIRAALAKVVEQAKPGAFPTALVSQFIIDQGNAGSSRRAAFELLRDEQTEKAEKMIGSFLDDPEPSLRREAVTQLLDKAEAKKGKTSTVLFRMALDKARDVDQITTAKTALEENGMKIDLPKLMGFLTHWQTIGPFANGSREGFHNAYAPERKVDLESSTQGKNGRVEWTEFSTSDPFGMLDINLQYGEIKEVLAYAFTTFESEASGPVQFRLGSKNAWKLWVNDELLFARDEYHRGKTRVDQFVIDGKLTKGSNRILVKVCQNEQTQPWTKNWEFCLRVTDPTGKALLPSNR